MSDTKKFNNIAEIIEDVRLGKMVILVDDEDRENEGDIILAADHVTPAAINFMASKARGLICLTLPSGQIQKLGLSLMVRDDLNQSANRTAFTLSIEASSGVTTGISAADRAHTIRVASDPDSTSRDITVPGHIFPIKAQDGGVLKRAGHTEASVDLAILAGLRPAAVICEIMNEDGTMARVPNLLDFARAHQIKIGTIEDLIHYRIEHDTFVEMIERAPFLTEYGRDFDICVFKNHIDQREHLALVKGQISPDEVTYVRVQTESIIGDVLGSTLHPSRKQIDLALKRLHEVERGVFIYLRTEDMDSRLTRSVRAQHLQTATSYTDLRDYGVGAQILRILGASKIHLLSNSTSKRVGLKGYGIEIVGVEPLNIPTHLNQEWQEL